MPDDRKEAALRWFLRGSILLTLKQCGHSVDSAVRYSIWDWDKV